jgi:predicted short-subunit dehydrogenase-like oxidoreductase (DUF2520 family)
MTRTKKVPRTRISIVGAGTLATALGVAFDRSGYRISEVVSRSNPRSVRRARLLAQRVDAQAAILQSARYDAEIVWICVPDDFIAKVAERMVSQGKWPGKIIVHSSGALSSRILSKLAKAGAHVASAHPLMTFVNLPQPDLRGVPFALEGDAKALQVITGVVRALGAKPFRIDASFKSAYHAFGFFSSPAFVELFAAALEVGKLAGLSEDRARELMEPIVRQTIDNLFRGSPQQAFSGPLRRGDTATIRKHLEVLKQAPDVRQAYRALARIALKKLPTRRADELRRVINS